jgi:predicted dehydrogenase
MPDERLRVGMVGCGEAVQSLHIPALNSLPKQFRITACCDVSEEVREDIASRTGSRATADPFALVRDPEVDVVLVTTPDSYHADVVLAACEARKKAVLVEKPLTIHSRIGKELIRRSRDTGVPVLLGYPHVYEPAFRKAREAWGEPGPFFSAEFRCIIGPNEKYTKDVVDTVRPSAMGPFDLMMSQMDLAAASTELLGIEIGIEEVVVHGTILGLLIHDFPVMRRILGEPGDVVYARARGAGGLGLAPGLGIDIVFDYGEARVLHQTEIQEMKCTDWGFDLRRADLQLSVRYPPTYAQSAPSSCIVYREDAGMTVEERHSGRYETGFRCEWKHLHEVVAGGAEPETNVEDAVRDLELVEQVTRYLVESSRRDATGRGGHG